MKNKVKNELKRAIISYMSEISFKSFLECTNDNIYDMYESEEFGYSDFYDIIEEIKKDTLEHYKSDDIPEICETVE